METWLQCTKPSKAVGIWILATSLDALSLPCKRLKILSKYLNGPVEGNFDLFARGGGGGGRRRRILTGYRKN
jgi:hypothetical protein